jgi:hypothetical protein
VNQQSGYAWTPIGGQTGAAASITAAAGGLLTITGLTLMAPASVLHVLTLSGCATPANNATCPIVAYLSASSVQILNPSGVAPDANNGAITWTESTLNLQEPATVGVPDDGDAWDAAEFAPGFEGLIERTTAGLYGALTAKTYAFTANANWVAPPGAALAIVVGCGGGAGGEGGNAGMAETDYGSNGGTCQGGGGGAAKASIRMFVPTPGTSYPIAIGGGGTGGAGGTPSRTGNGTGVPAGAGLPGGDTLITGAGLPIASFPFPGGYNFPGGAGPGAGLDASAFPLGSSPDAIIAPGGVGNTLEGRPPLWPQVQVMLLDSVNMLSNLAQYMSDEDGAGGSAVFAPGIEGSSWTGQPSTGGNSSQWGLSGGYGLPGSGGNYGTKAVSSLGGSGGGGGGGTGFSGIGGSGGNGGNGNSAGAGHNGSNGTDATGVGNGGGGGGGGGYGSTTNLGGTGGDGGDGAPGHLLIHVFCATGAPGPITTP